MVTQRLPRGTGEDGKFAQFFWQKRNWRQIEHVFTEKIAELLFKNNQKEQQKCNSTDANMYLYISIYVYIYIYLSIYIYLKNIFLYPECAEVQKNENGNLTRLLFVNLVPRVLSYPSPRSERERRAEKRTWERGWLFVCSSAIDFCMYNSVNILL